MSMCPRCKFRFLVPFGEEGQHSCPSCDWEHGWPREPEVEIVDEDAVTLYDTWVEVE